MYHHVGSKFNTAHQVLDQSELKLSSFEGDILLTPSQIKEITVMSMQWGCHSNLQKTVEELQRQHSARIGSGFQKVQSKNLLDLHKQTNIIPPFLTQNQRSHTNSALEPKNDPSTAIDA